MESTRDDEAGFVLSGTALLLVLPSLLLATTFLVVTEYGGEGTSIKALSDRATYTAYDIKRTVRNMKETGKRVNNEALTQLADKYSNTTIFADVEIETALFNIYENIYHNSGAVPYVHRADGPFCEVKNLGPGEWYYNFEDMETVPGADADFNEALLRLTKLENGDWRIAIENTYTSGYYADIFWGNQLIWDDANREGSDGSMDPHGGQWVGESMVVSGVPSTTFVHISLEDPAGNVHYEESFPLEAESGGRMKGDATAPSAPQNLTAEAESDSEISLDWDDVVASDLDHYNVYRSPSSGFTAGSSTKIGESSSSSYLDDGLSSGATYYYKVTAVDLDGNESQPSNLAENSTGLNESPVADFTYNPNYPAEGETITFDAENSYDPDGSIVSYEWDWTNDGTWDATDSNPSHSYLDDGSYTVKLRVTDDDGATDTVTQTVTVSETGPQYARPDSDVSTDSWSPIPLYQKIDETSPNNDDRIRSEDDPSDSSCEVGLSGVTDPQTSTGHVVRFRYRQQMEMGEKSYS